MNKLKVYSPYKKKKRKPQIRTLLKKYRNEDGSKVETEPERLMKNLLRSMGITFVQEHGIKYKNYYRVFDFYCELPDEYCFLVECDGDFWHAKEYYTEDKPLSKLHKVQKKNIRNDKLKNKMAKELGIPLLRFWESDLKNDPNKCKEKIQALIERQNLII